MPSVLFTSFELPLSTAPMLALHVKIMHYAPPACEGLRPPIASTRWQNRPRVCLSTTRKTQLGLVVMVALRHGNLLLKPLHIRLLLHAAGCLGVQVLRDQ